MGKIASWPLRAQFVALLAAASLLPLALAIGLGLAGAREQLRAGVEAVMAARGDHIVHELDAFHAGYQQAAMRLAGFAATQAACAAGAGTPGASDAGWRDISGAFPRTDPAVQLVALLDRRGRVVAATDDRLAGRRIETRDVAEAFAGRLLTTEVHVPAEPEDGSPVIAYYAPLPSADGPSACVVLLRVAAGAFWQALRSSDALSGPGSYAVLLDARGVRISHSELGDLVFHPAGPLAPAQTEALIAERRYGPRTRELLADVRPFPEQFERARAAQPDPAVFRGYAAAIGAWTYGVARRCVNAPWTVVYTVPEAPIDARLAALGRRWLAFGALLVGAAALAGFAFGGTIVRPLRRLAAATAAMARGELSTRVETGRRDELGRLALGFNAMAERLEAQTNDLAAARADLEERVRQRTAALDAEIAERRRAETTLRAQKALVQAIVDNTAAVIHAKDLEGRYLLVNRRFGELFRVDPAEAVGHTDAELFPPREAEAFRAADARAALAAGTLVEETSTAAIDGGRQTLLTLRSALREADGRIVGTFGIATDISDRKQAEARLNAQLERLQLLERITAAIGERQDLRSLYAEAVDRLEEWLPAAFCAVCTLDAEPPAFVPASFGPGARTFAEAAGLALGRRIPIDGNGLDRCAAGTLVHESTLEAAGPFSAGLAAVGLRSVVMAPLKADARVFGMLLVGRREAQAFSSADCEFLRQLSAHVALAALQAGLHGELQLAYDDLRRTQQSVLQQERLRALGQMASGIAHDINNAISPIALYAETLLDDEPGLSARARTRIQTIARAAEDVAATVARMRDFYRPREAGAGTQLLQLNALVPQVLELTRARWRDMPQRAGAVIHEAIELQQGLPEIAGEESELREALTHLVFNAADAMPEGGTMTLRTRAEAAADGRIAVVLEVSDTGTGMDEATRQRCLEPFFTTKGERGTGLGLAMVYGAAQRHGAQIRIASTPGAGTTVALLFAAPASVQPPGPAAAPAAAPAADSGPLRILVVDDDPMMRKSLAATLELEGHVVVAAAGGEAGIAAFRAARAAGDPVDLVISDLGMPHVDGRQVAAAVKAEPGTAVPVILLTGWGRRMNDEDDRPAHVDRVLGKPIRPRELREAIAELLAAEADSGRKEG